MNENKERAAAVLDKAIAEVFRNEVSHLIQSQNLSDAEKVSKVEYALDELGKQRQRQSEMPNYDEWVAPFYLSWYQPRQINLTYSMIADIVDEESICKEIFTDTGKLYVFDFGCGALAMQLGVALAIADALRNNQKIHSACVVSYDESEAMTNIGKKVWEQFKSEVRKDTKLPYLEQACDLIEMRADKPSFRMPQNDEIIWVSAIHSAFSANKDKVKGNLARLTKILRPSVGFVTSPITRSGAADFVSPFYRYDEYKKHELKRYGIFRGKLPKTTNARSALKLCLQGLTDKTISYLNKPVNWELRGVDVRIHTRRQS